MSKKPIQKHTEMHAETETHAEATIAAILTLAITPQNAAGHEPRRSASMCRRSCSPVPTR